MSLSTIYSLMRAGHLQAVKIGVSTVVLGASIAAYEASLRPFAPTGRKGGNTQVSAAAPADKAA